jgi:hypothetical protein
MKKLAALTAVLALAGLAACTSPGSSTAPAAATPASGTETISGKLTGLAAASDHPVFHLTLTGPVGTTATIQLRPEVPQQGDLYTFHTAVGDLAVILASAGTNTGDLKSAKTCLYALTTSVPFTVDGADSTGKFAGAAGTGTAVFMFSGDDPKLSDGTCNTSRYVQTSAKTSVARLKATIKLTVKQ